MRTKSILFLCFTLVFMLTLGGVAMAQDDVVTINFWRPDRSPESDPPAIWDDTGDLITAWAEEHPNIQVNINPIPFNELDTTQLTALRAGSSDVDVLLVNHVTIGAAIGTGGLEPLDDCIASQESMVAEDWIPGLYAAGQREGVQYTVPFDTDTRVMYYNKALLEEAGIETVPETWDDLYAAFDAIEALGGDAAPFYYPGLNKWFVLYHTIGPWLVQKQTSFLNPDGNASTTLDQATVEAWEHAIKLASYAPEASLTYNGEELEPLFAQGRMGFLFNGVWSVPTLAEMTDGEWNPGEEYGLALIPGPEAGMTGSANGGFHMAMAAASQNKEAACEFIAWATSPEVMAVATKDHIPTRVGAQETEFFQDFVGDNEATLLSLDQSVSGGLPVPAVVELPEIADLVLRQYNRAAIGEVSAQQALEELDQEITDLLSRR